MTRVSSFHVNGLKVSSLILIAALAAGGGCPGQQQPPENQAPNANAGGNQSVAQGANVTLDGSGSSDPDGDNLTFQWSQTAGTNVALSGANTATATFTAPNANDTLTFQLTVSDGSLQDSAFATITVGAGAGAQTPQLFITNFTGNNVTSYQNPATVNGNIAPDTNLAGAQTQLFAPSDAIVTANGSLIVSNFNVNSLTRYDNAANSNGNLDPTGIVQGAATQLLGPASLAVNTNEDLVFVANFNGAPDNITVYNNASAAGFNGNLAPVRTINSAAINNPSGINFGANDDLYVANSGDNTVLVFANASNLNGNVTPTRTITSAAFTNVFDVFIDNSDNLFVVNSTGTINVFNNAATLNAAQTPDSNLVVQGAGVLTAIEVSSNNTGYIVDNAQNAVYAYNNVSTRNGTFAPDRTIQGANTQLLGPIRLFLVE